VEASTDTLFTIKKPQSALGVEKYARGKHPGRQDNIWVLWGAQNVAARHIAEYCSRIPVKWRLEIIHGRVGNYPHRTQGWWVKI
jgi:hypothetical protein